MATSEPDRLRFAILASGRGSNADALMDAFESGFINADLVLVVTNKEGAPVVATAASRGYATATIPSKGMKREAHEELVLAALARANVDHILLAGYMRILTPGFLRRFLGSVINIHPALLPDFPGLNAASRQWEAGAKVAGATVHFVDEGVDTGQPILMGTIDVRGDEGPDGLAQRILNEVEHVIYPRAVQLFVDRLVRQTLDQNCPNSKDQRKDDRAMTKTAKGKVTRALISVYDKSGLVDFAKGLRERDVEILASGGTARALEEAGVSLTRVEDYTGAKELLGGRVKTLHPRIHAGILADRRNEEHLAQLAENDVLPIDLVVCTLYPFRETLALGGTRAELIEKIDVGGPTMIRAAAKNADGGVTVVTDPADYDPLLCALGEDGTVADDLRRRLAVKAFRLTADYDDAIASWGESGQSQIDSDVPAGDAASTIPERIGSFVRRDELRYGENPHQRGFLYVDAAENRGVAHGELLCGKPLSYNNYLDLDGAYRAVHLLAKPGCAIIKHTNPCGLAEGSSQDQSFRRALAGDPVSAFGSVIGFNAALEGATAEAIKETKLFVECIVAPSFTDEARKIFEKRKNLRLVQVSVDSPDPAWHAHRIGGGLLIETTDPGLGDPSQWKCVTKKQPEEGWLDELAFAMRAAATLKSNAIAVTRGRALLGAGAGQMSRVDAAGQALAKAGAMEGGVVKGSFLGSDAFFPFDDSVRPAAAAGVVAVIQPGGSKRDDEVIAACDELGLCMVFTGRRHFRH